MSFLVEYEGEKSSSFRRATSLSPTENLPFTTPKAKVKADRKRRASGVLVNRNIINQKRKRETDVIWEQNVEEPVSDRLEAQNTGNRKRKGPMVGNNDEIHHADLKENDISKRKTGIGNRGSDGLMEQNVEELVSDRLVAENTGNQKRKSPTVASNDEVDHVDPILDPTDIDMSKRKPDSQERASDVLWEQNVEEPVSNGLEAENIRNQKRVCPAGANNDEVDDADPIIDLTNNDMSKRKTDSQARVFDILWEQDVEEPVSNVLEAESSRNQKRESHAGANNGEADHADPIIDLTNNDMSKRKTDSQARVIDVLWEQDVEEPVSNVLEAESSRNQKRESHAGANIGEADHADQMIDLTDNYIFKRKTDSQKRASDVLGKQNVEEPVSNGLEAENIRNQKRVCPAGANNGEADADQMIDLTDNYMYKRKTDSQKRASDVLGKQEIKKPRNQEDFSQAENIRSQKRKRLAVEKNDEVNHKDPTLNRANGDTFKKPKLNHFNEGVYCQEEVDSDFEDFLVKLEQQNDESLLFVDQNGQKVMLNKGGQNPPDRKKEVNIKKKVRKEKEVNKKKEVRKDEEVKKNKKVRKEKEVNKKKEFRKNEEVKKKKKVKIEEKVKTKKIVDEEKADKKKRIVKEKEVKKKKEVNDHESSRLTFREKLMDFLLTKPYDDKECDHLWIQVSIRKPTERHRESRSGRIKPIILSSPGRSHLDITPRLAAEVKKVKNDRRKLLYILRGYFFWMQSCELILKSPIETSRIPPSQNYLDCWFGFMRCGISL
ncbi:hypothetical protein ACFE04_004537 [Oxalis oulophora]